KGYIHFFKHTEAYMQYMANQLRKGQAPANIMNEIRSKQKVNSLLNISPNDLCPCGSGKKFKKCCGVNKTI
ncbi:MAG: SEC-C metal-binding domain-containing protein, partial [Candidatus Hydrogenedens sp.]